MKHIRFTFLYAMIAMALAFTAAAQQPEPAPKDLLRGKQIVQTGVDNTGNNLWALKDPPKTPRKFVPAPTPYINSFGSDANEVNAGEPVTLNFSVTAAKTVTINGQDVTGDTQLVVTPTSTTAYRLVAISPGGRVAEDLVVRVKPIPVPTSTDWNKFINDWSGLIVLILVLVLAAWLISQYMDHRRWREDQAAYAETERHRQRETPPAEPAPTQPAQVTNNITISYGGPATNPAATTEAGAPQTAQTSATVAANPAVDPMSGEEPATTASVTNDATASTQSNEEPAAATQTSGTN